MKKISTLLVASCIATISFGQTVFQSNLSSWASGDPTDWMGTSTSISSANVVEQTVGSTYGTSTASLVNATTSHKRFTTQPVAVTPGETYEIKMWVSAQNSGEIRTNYYNTATAGYGTYNPYIDLSVVSAGTLVMISQQVTVGASCSNAEFILSVRNTDPSTSSLGVGIIVDSVAISVATPIPPSIKKIYDIQYTTNPNGDSPELGNTVTTKGVVTGIVEYGPARHSFFIQDSASAWNGLYIYQTTDSSLVIGDSVEVTGTVMEYNGGVAPQMVTELGSVSNITVLNSGNSLPAPITISTANANMEEWEGVLINVTSAQCTSNSVGFGMWSLDDGSGIIQADDDIYPYALSAVVGTYYDVVGIGHYSFDEYKILPRDVNDVSITTGIDETKETHFNVYPNPASSVINFELNTDNATVQLMDVTGKTLKTVLANTNKFSISLSNLANGIYFYSVTDVEGNTIAANRFVVAK